MPTGWTVHGYLARPEAAYVCTKFATGSFSVTIALPGTIIDDTTARELSWLLNSLARGALRTDPGQYKDNEATPLTVTGLMVTLPVVPPWYVRVNNADDGPTDLLVRVKTAGLAGLQVMLDGASGPKCSAALKDYPGKVAKKPAYLPAGWSPRVLESFDKKAQLWTAMACLESGPFALRAQLAAVAPPGAIDAQALSALLTAVAAAKQARDGGAALPYQGTTTDVQARQAGLVVAVPTGPVDWEVMNFRSEHSDVFTRGRPALPSVVVQLIRAKTACTQEPVHPKWRSVAHPSYAPADWGPAHEDLADPTVIDANLCRGKLLVTVRMPANSPPRDHGDVRDLLAAIARADKP